MRFDSIESVDSQGSDFSSLQSFSSFEERKEWLLSFEAYLRNMDYYCDNQSSKCKYSSYVHIIVKRIKVTFNVHKIHIFLLVIKSILISDYEYPIHLLLSSFVVCFIGILWSTYGSISNVWLTGFLYTSSALLGMSSIYYFVKGHYLNNKIPILTKIFDKSRNNNRKN